MISFHISQISVFIYYIDNKRKFLERPESNKKYILIFILQYYLIKYQQIPTIAT